MAVGAVLGAHCPAVLPQGWLYKCPIAQRASARLRRLFSYGATSTTITGEAGKQAVVQACRSLTPWPGQKVTQEGTGARSLFSIEVPIPGILCRIRWQMLSVHHPVHLLSPPTTLTWKPRNKKVRRETQPAHRSAGAVTAMRKAGQEPADR